MAVSLEHPEVSLLATSFPRRPSVVPLLLWRTVIQLSLMQRAGLSTGKSAKM
ncbi:hypothetical protein AZE42_13688 [Rhizopogon vesiculosus]|uniref:Uncharacterized protein n=1 Tax=Rhizopogon vesiculosus TaxID=180088 RepID=A0A1J8QL89_9AGAM|nr:hypothetical protein AZE42_13688 [Rhizopogon vesiculosus]